MEAEQKKKCFIVTPIGGESDPIRRHIDGIIKAAIRPALGDKYELIVAHEIYEPGSITKQVISEIYNSELVIANLTNRNPNVMYELAFRHSLGRPVIMIAESGTNLPSDIIMERVIFYHDDAQGVLDLQEALAKADSGIDFSKTSSPIYDVLHSTGHDINILQISQNDTQTENNASFYTMEKLKELEELLWTIIDEERKSSHENISHTKSQESVKHSRILWVDDYPINNEAVMNFLKSKNVSFDIAISTEIGIDYFKRNKYDIIITDMGRGIERNAGIKLIDKLIALDCKTPIIVYASLSAIHKYGQQAKELGAHAVINGTANIIAALSDLLKL